MSQLLRWRLVEGRESDVFAIKCFGSAGLLWASLETCAFVNVYTNATMYDQLFEKILGLQLPMLLYQHIASSIAPS